MDPERNTKMIKSTLFISILMLIIGTPFTTAGKILSPGDLFPSYRFLTELSTADAAYLGVAEEIGRKGFFLAGDIWGDVLVLELLNRFCFSCQQGAPLINKAYELVGSDPALSRKVRFLGIGVGNNRKTIDDFRSEFDVQFPLMPDPRLKILDTLGNPGGTPYTMVFRRTTRGLMLMGSHFGVLDSPEDFVGEIRKILSADVKQLLENTKPVTIAQWVEKEQAPPMKENEIETLVLESMDRAGYGSVGLYSVDMPDGDKVYIGESGRGKVFSKIISRLPVCDLCHPVHFILTVNTKGQVVDFGAIVVTKYWNKPWTDQEAEQMRQKLLGLSLFEDRVFDPSVDAVSTATMSSALIFDSLQRTAPMVELLRKAGHL